MFLVAQSLQKLTKYLKACLAHLAIVQVHSDIFLTFLTKMSLLTL